MFGALNIHKPLNMTSHQVVARLRRIFNLKRIGHLGTLDPLAEGVLPVCLGQATRLIEYFPSGKRYTAEVTLGRTTATLDSEGEELSRLDCSGLELSEQRLNDDILERFRGTILQQVPLYSAVHVEGQKLYKLARQGRTAELPSRETTIYELTLLELNRENPPHPVLKLDVRCSSGTYIRSLARDIGEALGCGAYLSALVRTEHGRFRLEDSVSLEELEGGNPGEHVLDPAPFLKIRTVDIVSEEDARKLAHGLASPIAEAMAEGEGPCLAMHGGRPIGVVTFEGGQTRPVKIFADAQEALHG